MPKQLFLLDTLAATKNIDSFNKPHSYNVTFPFKIAAQYVKSITLKSVEIPYFISTIRSGNGSNTFSYTYSYPGYADAKRTVTLNAGNYTTTNLISALNTAISADLTILNIGLTMNLTAQTGALTGLTICRITTNAIGLTLDNTLLINQVLGYSLNRSTTSTAFDSQSPINTSFSDTCIFMYISNLPVVNNNFISLNSSPPYTFKIPLNTTINNIVYFNDVSEHQTIYFSNNNSFILDKLDIKIYDRWGYLLFGYYDYTLTLLIEYYDDDTNINQLQFLNLNN